MNRLYKRLVTIGMISFTALLGWIYCIAEYKNQPVYVICVSIALIVSVYALLRSVISLRQKKDQKLKSDINDAVSHIIADFFEAQESANAEIEKEDKEPEVERICKALYVQLRKVNTTLSKDLITKDILNNATKVNIKYNHANSEKLLTAISELSESLKLAPIQPAASSEASVQTSVNVTEAAQPPQPQLVEEPEENVSAMVNDFLSDALAESKTPIEEEAVTPEPETYQGEPGLEALAGESSLAAQSFFDEFEAKDTAAQEAEPVAETADETAETDTADISNILEFPTPEPVAEPEPIPEPEPEPALESAAPASSGTIPPPPPTDDNKVLSPEEIAALFSSMQ
ncbi:MAG: hypothetical protein IJ763_06420 [Lachnospiraceae bacterium]|nr:hypothetical protein [Lachnospiraceae bacterium]